MSGALSSAIEEARERPRENGKIVKGLYEFDLLNLQQKNLTTNKVRKIRRVEVPHDQWGNTLYEENHSMKLELSRLRTKLLKKKRELSQRNDEQRRLMQRDEEYVSQISGLQSEIMVLKAELQRAADLKTQLNDKIDVARAESTAAKLQVSALKEKLNDASTERKAAEERAAALNATLTNEVNTLCRASQEKTRELCVLRQEGERCRRMNLELQQNLDTLTKRNEALHLELRSASFQAGLQLLMQAAVSDATAVAKYRRLQCPIDSVLEPSHLVDSATVLHSFGNYVVKAFFDTRASHSKDLTPNAEMCPLPEYEVEGVEAVINADLAEKFRLCIQTRIKEQGAAGHAYAAQRVAQPIPAMQLLSLSLGSCCWDDSLLFGWHGASDETISLILEDGFNPVCVGEGAGSLFGKGIYSAENSSKADLYAGPRDRRFKRHKGRMTVILSAIYGGNMYEAKTSGKWTKPPVPDEAQAAGIRRSVLSIAFQQSMTLLPLFPIIPVVLGPSI